MQVEVTPWYVATALASSNRFWGPKPRTTHTTQAFYATFVPRWLHQATKVTTEGPLRFKRKAVFYTRPSSERARLLSVVFEIGVVCFERQVFGSPALVNLALPVSTTSLVHTYTFYIRHVRCVVIHAVRKKHRSGATLFRLPTRGNTF